MTTTQIDKVVNLVQKLMAKANDKAVSENEAAIFAEKAQAILAEHNLSMSDVSAKQKKDQHGKVETDNEIKVHSYPWHRSLANAVARMYFCRHFYTTVRVPGKNARAGYNVHHFVGEPHNIAVAKVMFTYLRETVERLASEGAKGQANRGSYITSFQNSCSGRLCSRIMDRIEQAKRGEIKTEAGKNLPALLSLYEQTDKRLQAYLNETQPGLRNTSSRMRNNSMAGHMDGIAAGNKIGLDQQVGRNHRDSKMLTH